jgi:hypothetical protein
MIKNKSDDRMGPRCGSHQLKREKDKREKCLRNNANHENGQEQKKAPQTDSLHAHQ